LASPRITADSIARSLAASGWQIGRVAAELTELRDFDQGIETGDILVAVDGEIPADAVAEELRRRRPGLRPW
jgi:hypothetical protein